MSKQKAKSSQSSEREEFRVGMRFLPVFIFVFAILLLFLGGAAAFLYWLFAEYSGVRSVWLLVCGAPLVVVMAGFTIVYGLYNRYGKPLQQMFSAIDSVAEGDLTARVPADDSPQFGELIKRFNKMVAELERADQQRRNLTADIAHELRTPLHIIQGKLEGMLDGVYAAEPKHIDDALEETKLLTRLVNDLQTLSLAETGQLPLHHTRFLLADLVSDVSASFSAQATALGVDLKASIADPNKQVSADYVRLNQVLSNLVSNALRYTPKGGSIFLEAGSGAGEKGNVRIRVTDTGVGIAPEDLPFIFDRFWRGEKARARDGHANSGLGLAIARQLIHAHAGTIEAQSNVGKGTSFVIELPDQI